MPEGLTYKLHNQSTGACVQTLSSDSLTSTQEQHCVLVALASLTHGLQPSVTFKVLVERKEEIIQTMATGPWTTFAVVTQ